MAKIAVLGAGVMGLACAYDLLQKGDSVDIYEADDRVGGMSAHFDFSGANIERYYHFICKTDYELFGILDEFKIQNKLMWVNTKMGYYYDGELYPWGNPFALFTFPKLDLVSKIRYALHAFISTKRHDWSKLDKTEATAWIKKWVGNKAYAVLWDKLFSLKFYEYKGNLSAAWIWTRIRRVGLSRKNIFQEQLGYIEGGSETLLERFEQKIYEHCGKIYLSTPAEKVCISNGKVTGIQVNGEHFQYDAVISTVPLPYVTKLIPDLPDDYIEQYNDVKNIGVVCVVFKLKKQVTENFWLNINDQRIDVPGIIEFSNLRPLPSSIVYVPYYLPQEHEKYSWSNENFIKESTEYLKMVKASLSDDDILDVHVSRYGFAQPICPPGFLDSLPPIDTKIEGLYVADTSYYYPEDRSISESVKLGRKIASMVSI